jgi:hypothetical protein
MKSEITVLLFISFGLFCILEWSDMEAALLEQKFGKWEVRGKKV